MRKLVLLFLIATAAWATCPDSPSGYGYCYPLTMESDKVTGAADLTNYIVRFHKTYAWLATTANGGVVQQDDGDDIIFYQGGAQLAHQRYSYNPTTGAYGALIKIPVLDYNDDGLIYVYLGNASASDTSTTNVYDANYVGLYHLEEARSTDAGNYKDSVKTNHGTLTDANANTVQDTGKFGYAVNFSGDNADVISAGDPGTVMNGATLTIIAWLNGDDYGSTYPRVLARSGTPIQFAASVASDTRAGFTVDTVTTDFDTAVPLTAISATVTHHVVWRYDGSAITVFTDGAIDGTDATPEGVLANGTGIIQIGNRADTIRPWDGILDEIEYHNTHRSDDWLYTRYNIDNDQAGFWTAGAQDTVGGGAAARRYAPVVMD